MTNEILERHAQTILSGLLLIVLGGWIGWSSFTLLEVKERLVRIESIKVSEVTNDQYVSSELQSLRTRLRDVELRQEVIFVRQEHMISGMKPGK